MERVAKSIGIEVEGKDVRQVGQELCDELEKTFSMQGMVRGSNFSA